MVFMDVSRQSRDIHYRFQRASWYCNGVPTLVLLALLNHPISTLVIGDIANPLLANGCTSPLPTLDDE